MADDRGTQGCAWRRTVSLPLIERKALLKPPIEGIPGLQFSDHETGDGELIRKHACELGLKARLEQ